MKQLSLCCVKELTNYFTRLKFTLMCEREMMMMMMMTAMALALMLVNPLVP